LIGAGARRQIALVLLGATVISTASPAFATPKRRNAKAQFDRGVAAYRKENYVVASQALARSFDLERDVDTLFAWAQSERKLNHCDKASELYEKILTFDLPAANREAVDEKLAECRGMIADAKAESPAVTEPPRVEPVPAAPVAPPPTPTPAAVVFAQPPVAPAPRVDHAWRPWYKDPIALTLLGVGIVGTGAGAALLVSANSLDGDFKTAFRDGRYDDALHLSDQAKSRGTIGLVTTAAGGAVLIGGLAWIALRHHEPEPAQTALSGWLTPAGGGIALTGGF
jgi:hypothetical protein